MTPSYAASGRAEALGRWLDGFGDARINMHPTLSLAAAVHRLMHGDRDRAERWADAAERGLGSMSAASRDSLLAGLAIVRAGVARHGAERMDEDAARAYALSEADSPWRAFACVFRGAAALATGHPDCARTQLDEGARRGADGAPCARVLCLAQLALLALEQEDWDQGSELAGRARDESQRPASTRLRPARSSSPWRRSRGRTAGASRRLVTMSGPRAGARHVDRRRALVRGCRSASRWPARSCA